MRQPSYRLHMVALLCRYKPRVVASLMTFSHSAVIVFVIVIVIVIVFVIVNQSPHIYIQRTFAKWPVFGKFPRKFARNALCDSEKKI